MRRLLTVLLVLSATLAVAQNRVHLGVGYNQSYTRLDSLDYVLRSFNAENSWTSERPFRPVHLLSGVTAHIGADFSRVLVDFQFTMRLGGSRARSTLASAPQQVQVRVGASTVDLGVGYVLYAKPRLRIALGQSIDFGNLRASTRRSTIPPQQGQLWARNVNELNFATSSFAHIMIAFQDGVGPGIFIMPYYQVAMRSVAFGPVNRNLRPTESLSDPIYLLGRPSNVGLKVGVMLGS